MASPLAPTAWEPAPPATRPRGARPTTLLTAVEDDATSRVNPVLAFLFCVMIASFPIELPQRTFRWEVPTITTSLFLAATMLQPTVSFARMHAGLLALLTFVLVYAGSALAHGWPDNMHVAQMLLFIVQAMLMAWAAFNLMQYDRLARRALWWYVAGCFIRTVLPMTGLVEHSGHVEGSTGAERVSAFGQDPNYSAMLLSAALLISLGLNFGPRRVSNQSKLVGLGLAGFFALAIVNTGSRGGLIALVAGVGCFALAKARNPMDRIRSTGIVVVGLMAITYFVMTSYVMRKRIETTASGEVSMAGREVLFPNLWNMFLEKPLNGWGPVNNYYEVVVRGTELVLRPEQVSKDPHNLFLELLTSTGLLGTVPFVLALALCFRAAWRARDGDYGVIPLALMAVFLMANVSLNQVAHKPFWFFMAFALATQVRLGRSGTPGFSQPS